MKNENEKKKIKCHVLALVVVAAKAAVMSDVGNGFILLECYVIVLA